MSQPVRVSLVFPRSGQQVFVYVPPHVAESVDSRRFDHKPHHPETISPYAPHRNSGSRNSDADAQ
jgi:hypothetical protein